MPLHTRGSLSYFLNEVKRFDQEVEQPTIFFVCFHKKCSRLMIYIYLYKKDAILGEDWLDRRILLKTVYTHTSKMIRCA